jgi:hypothetical protein
MGAVPAGFEGSDLQAQARHALERVSEDILLAGTDLPLEFPAFTPPGVNPALDRGGDGPDAVEIIGHFQQDASGSSPIRVVSFDGQTALLESVPTQIERGQLVLVYDDKPKKGSWIFGIVTSVRGWPQPALTVVTEPGAVVDESRLPPFIERYNRSRPSSGFLTPVTVVTYVVAADSDDFNPYIRGAEEGERVLWRQVDWGPPVQVAFVEDLQIRYLVGGTVVDHPRVIYGHGLGAQSEKSGQEKELDYAPVPQPNSNRAVQVDRIVRGVRVHVTSRSHEANLEGSTVLPGQSPEEDGYIRKTYSSRVSSRNLLFKLHERQNLKGFN